MTLNASRLVPISTGRLTTLSQSRQRRTFVLKNDYLYSVCKAIHVRHTINPSHILLLPTLSTIPLTIEAGSPGATWYARSRIINGILDFFAAALDRQTKTHLEPIGQDP